MDNKMKKGNKTILKTLNHSPSMKLLWLCLLLSSILLILPLVSAANTQTDYVFRQYDTIDLKVPCIDNGAYCNAAGANCTITVTAPNSTIVVNKKDMTNSGSFHNYTLTGDKTAVLGIYSVGVSCNDVGGRSGWVAFSYEITTAGVSYNSIFDNPMIFIFFAITLIVFIIALVMKNLYLSFIAGGSFLLTGIYVYIYGFLQTADSYTRALAMIIIAMGVYLSIASAFDIVESEGESSDSFMEDGE